MQKGGGATHPVTEHRDMDGGANSTDKTTQAIVLQSRYTVTVNIPLSARRCF
jgi:hypothetical protein